MQLTTRTSILSALFAFAVVLLFAIGCTPLVGDSCTTSADCAARDARVCDTSVPNGYCTAFDCTRNSCPEESICVDFGVLSACMRRCKDGKCPNRDEPYTCRDDIGPAPFCYVPADFKSLGLDVSRADADGNVE